MITAVVWASLGMPESAVVRVITVLVIACPHALGLAIPLVVSIATERAARGGVLIKDRLALETMRNVDAVLFDKTGVLRLADEIRPESPEAVAESVADELGIDRVFAGVRPENKSAKVAELQAEGRTVTMVGDDVNDAPALARADVAVARPPPPRGRCSQSWSCPRPATGR